MQDHQGQLDHRGQRGRRENKVMTGRWKARRDHPETEAPLVTEEIEGNLETLVILVKKGLMEKEENLDSKAYLGILDHQASQEQRDPKVMWVKKESKEQGAVQGAEAHRAPLGYQVLEEWWEGRVKRVPLEWTECLGRMACLGCWESREMMGKKV